MGSTSMIICIGTTPTAQRTMFFDRLVPGEVNRAAAVFETASGKSINVALVLRALGEGAIASGFLGGPRGAFIRTRLDELGIRHHFITTAVPTRLCTTVIDRAGGTTTELVEESLPLSEDDWQNMRRMVWQLLGLGSMLVLSGSLPPGAPQDFYRYCIEAAAKEGIESIIDGRGEPLRQSLPLRPLLVKPNRSELAGMFELSIQSEAELKDAAKRLTDMGARWALITMGREGALLTDGTDCWRITPPAIEAVNAIGSGDSMTAGVAVALRQGKSMLDATVFGTACAAANALTQTTADVRPADVERLLGGVRVESVG